MSTDTGNTWVELKLAGDINNGWIVSGISNDGSVMIAGAYSGRLYMSTTTGAIWNEVKPAVMLIEIGGLQPCQRMDLLLWLVIIVAVFICLPLQALLG
jgi:hypothetical protein